jgi:hypothetical protein
MDDLTPAAPPEQLEQWEETFAAGLTANSREAPEPWLGGYVHVVEETMPLPEPVRTDPGSVHRLLFMPNGAKGLRERVAGGPLHDDDDYGSGTIGVFPPKVSRGGFEAAHGCSAQA